jgi:hypothetical protein
LTKRFLQELFARLEAFYNRKLVKSACGKIVDSLEAILP